MTIAVPAAEFKADGAPYRREWQHQGAMLGGVALVVLVLFGHDSADLARIWWTSTTFGHCLFIGPVIAWLVWQRRHDLAQLQPVAWARGLAVVAIGGLGWMLGDLAQVSLARHLGLVILLQGAVITLLGPQVARGITFPLVYAFFLVPFGESLEGPLQGVTAVMTIKLLHAAGVPAAIDGVLITIPNGYFEVAEACSGAKFVIAMAAFATLVANVCFISWPRRIAFIVAALIVPVIANGLRAFGTIYAAHLTSVAAATGFDHIVYGWIFFGLVMAAVLAIGWRWFDRDPDAAWFDAGRLQALPQVRIDPLIAAALLLATAASFPGLAAAFDARPGSVAARVSLPEIAGWRRSAMSMRAPWGPNYPDADHLLLGRYVDKDGAAVDLAIAVYADQHQGKELVRFGTGALREDDRWVRVAGLPDIAGGSAMRISAPGPVERIVVTWYRIGDTLTASAKQVKIETLRAKLFGGPQRAVAIHLSAEAGAGSDPKAAIERFLEAIGPLDRLADRSAEPNG